VLRQVRDASAVVAAGSLELRPLDL
jgi:hypothetical protein